MARIIELTCPQCSSHEADSLGHDQFRCTYCAAVFLVERKRPTAPVVVQPTPRSAPLRASLAKGVVVVVAIAIFVAAVGLIAVIKQFGRGPTEAELRTRLSGTSGVPRVRVPSIQRTSAEASPPPKAELRDVQHARLPRGTDIWIGTLANTGQVPIERPSALVSLFDAQGKRVGEHHGWAPIELLAPGQTTPVLVMIMRAPVYSRFDAAPGELRTTSYSPPQLATIKVTEQTVQPYLTTMQQIVGTVRNVGSKPARFVQVIAVGRDGDGKLASYASNYVSRSDLAPGAESGFSVTSGTFEIRRPARFEVFAVGRE